MEVYRADKHQILEPRKLIVLPDGYEVISNDGTIKIELRSITVMDAGMENRFYHTIMWIKEDNAWIKVDGSQNYHSKEDFIKAIASVEEFTQAIDEYDKYGKSNE